MYYIDYITKKYLFPYFQDKVFQFQYSLFLFTEYHNCLRNYYSHRGTVVKDKFVSQHLSGAGSVGRDLNLQKLRYQYLTTSVGVVLVVR